MLGILYEHGELYLSGGQYKPQRLSWEEVQALTGPDTVGLPIGYGDQQQQDPAVGYSRGSGAPAAALQGSGLLLAHCKGMLEAAAGRYEQQQREVADGMPLMLLTGTTAAAAGPDEAPASALCCCVAAALSSADGPPPAVMTRKSVILAAVSNGPYT